EDGDLIAFSTDDELMMGVACRKDDTFRLFIREKKEHRREFPLHAFPPPFNFPPPPPGAPHAPPPPHAAMVHPNVTCDGCEGAVVGTRFKCTVCPDYDLCSPCQAKGLHKDHALLPIWHPLNSMFQWFPHGKWMRKMRHCGMWNQTQNQNQSQTQNQTQDQPGASSSKPGEAAAENSAPSASQANVDFLKNIGEEVAAMLSPLGIDVDIDVEHEGHRTKVTPPTNSAGVADGSEVSMEMDAHSSVGSASGAAKGSRDPGSDEEWTHLSSREVDPSTGELQSLQMGEQVPGPLLDQQGPPSGQQGPPSGQQGPPSGKQGPPSGKQGPPSGQQGPPSGQQGPPSGQQGPPSGPSGLREAALYPHLPQ
ncbi:sequestosome-1-like, partial [Diretmus argenteus]